MQCLSTSLCTLPIDGSTGLHQAAYSGSIDMVALLLSLGADGLKRVRQKYPCTFDGTMTLANFKRFLRL